MALYFLFYSVQNGNETLSYYPEPFEKDVRKCVKGPVSKVTEQE
jgi:hypothetical protein